MTTPVRIGIIGQAEDAAADGAVCRGVERLIVFGSADFAATLTQHGMIDEYRIAVNPVVLGEGTPLFKEHGVRRNLRLLGTRIFRSGIVELRYAPTAVGG